MVLGKMVKGVNQKKIVIENIRIVYDVGVNHCYMDSASAGSLCINTAKTQCSDSVMS